MLAMNLPSLSRSIVAQYQILYMRLFPSCVEHALPLRRARTLRADKIRPPESKSDSLVRFIVPGVPTYHPRTKSFHGQKAGSSVDAAPNCGSGYTMPSATSCGRGSHGIKPDDGGLREVPASSEWTVKQGNR